MSRTRSDGYLFRLGICGKILKENFQSQSYQLHLNCRKKIDFANQYFNNLKIR